MKSLILLGSCICVFVPVFSQESAPFPPPPSNVSSVATMVGEDEPGEKLIIDGIVYEGDGRTPLPGFVFYLYQTDATGVYNKIDGNWQRPRIRGWIRTDDDGKYQIRTIKPGSYPGSRNPAHIHVIVKPSGEDPDWIDEFLFDGDPFLTAKDRERLEVDGTFSPVMKVTRDESGILYGRRDITIAASKE